MVRGGNLEVSQWCPLFISHQYHYAGTWTGHMTYSLIWSVTNKGMHCCATFAGFCHFFQKTVRGATLVVPPVHNSSIPVCRHMDRTCSLHMTYSLIWSVTNKGMNYCTTFAKFCHFPKTVGGDTLVVPTRYPLFRSHQYQYAGTCTGHVASIWHIVWFDQLPIRVCTNAMHLVKFTQIARVTPFDQPWQPRRYEWAPWKRAKSVKCYLIMLNICGDIGLWTWQGLQNFFKMPHITVFQNRPIMAS